MLSSEDILSAAINDVEWFLPEGSAGFSDANYYPPGIVYRVTRDNVSFWVTCHGEGAVRLRDNREVTGWRDLRNLEGHSFSFLNNAWFEVNSSEPGYGIEVHKILEHAVAYADKMVDRICK